MTWLCVYCFVVMDCFFFQAEDGIRDLVRSRGLGDVYKRQDEGPGGLGAADIDTDGAARLGGDANGGSGEVGGLSLIHI